MANLHEGPAWAVDETARALHQQGLDFEVGQHKYQVAHQTFGAALVHLESLAQTPAVQLQRARIMRDDAFTDVRVAAETRTPGEAAEPFTVAYNGLHRSSSITASLLKGTVSGEQRRELES